MEKTSQNSLKRARYSSISIVDQFYPMWISSITPGLTDISRGIVFMVFHKFSSKSTPSINACVFGCSTILELIRETKTESTELALGRNDN